MKGLDNYVVEGVKVFEECCKVVLIFGRIGMGVEWIEDIKLVMMVEK